VAKSTRYAKCTSTDELAYIKMSEQDETTCVESTVLEQSNELQQINLQSFVTSSNLNNKTGTDKDEWHWVKLCPTCAGSVLDCGKNSSNKYWQYLEVALLSAVVVVVLLLMLLPTIFYNLPLPVPIYVIYVLRWCTCTV